MRSRMDVGVLLSDRSGDNARDLIVSVRGIDETILLSLPDPILGFVDVGFSENLVKFSLEFTKACGVNRASRGAHR